MIRTGICLAACLSLSACSEEDPTVSRETSPGGHVYSLATMPGQVDVSLHVVWDHAWTFDEGANPAVPYVGVDLILAGGADGYPAGDVVERFADLNSEAYLTAAPDLVFGEVVFAVEHLAETIEVANAHLTAPSLDPAWFDRIAEGFRQRVGETLAQPNQRLLQTARLGIFGDSHFADALTLDDSRLLADLSLDAVARWHARTFTSAPLAIAIAGDLDPEDAGRAIDALLAGLPEATAPGTAIPEADYSGRRVLLHDPALETSHLAAILALPPTRAGGEFEDLIIRRTLADGETSVLFEAIRRQERAAYAFGAFIDGFTRNDRFLTMIGSVETARLGESEAALREAYGAFRAAGPGTRMAAAADALAGPLAEVLSDPQRLAQALLLAELDGDAPDRIFGLEDELDAVSAEDVTARLRTIYAAPDDLIILALSPDRDALPGACVIDTPRDVLDCP